MYKGQDEKAIRVVQHIARTNKYETRLTLATFEALKSNDEPEPTETREDGSRADGGGVLRSGARTFKRMKPTPKKVRSGTNRYKLLFSSFTMARLTILVWLTYIMDFWGFTVAGTCALLHNQLPIPHVYTHTQLSGSGMGGGDIVSI